MKRLFILLICISVEHGLFAQVTDSTHTDSIRTGNVNNTVTNPSPTDSSSTNTLNVPRDTANSFTNSTNNMNNNSMNNTTDTAHTMSNMHNSNSTNNMNNNSMNNMSNMKNGMRSMSGANAFAALPVKESYIPDDILSKIKSKYGNGTVIYDITATRAVMLQDSSMTQQNNRMRTDSSVANALNNNGDSTVARNSNMMQNSSMAMPRKYNYMVRMISNGTLQSEWVGDDGTTAVTPGEMNKQ